MADQASEVDVAAEVVLEVKDGKEENGEEQGLDHPSVKEAGRKCSPRPGDSPRREKGDVNVAEEVVHEVKDGKEENGEEKGQDYLPERDSGRERSLTPCGSPRRETREVDAADEKDDKRENRGDQGQDDSPQEDSGRRERSPRPWDQKSEDREDSFIALATNNEFRAQEEEERIHRKERFGRSRSRQRDEGDRLERRSRSPRRHDRERSPFRRERGGTRERLMSRERGHHRGRRDGSKTPQHRDRPQSRGYQRDRSSRRGRMDSSWDRKRDRSRDGNRRNRSPLPERQGRRDSSNVRRHRDSSLQRERRRDSSLLRGRRDSSLHRGRGRERRSPHSEHLSVSPNLDYGEPVISPISPSLPKERGKAKDTEDSKEGKMTGSSEEGQVGEDEEVRGSKSKENPADHKSPGKFEEPNEKEVRGSKRKRSPSRDLSPYSNRRQLMHPAEARGATGAQSERGERVQRPRKPLYDHWTLDDKGGDRPRRESSSRHHRDSFRGDREDSGFHEQPPDPRFRDFREEREERARQRNLKRHRGDVRGSCDYGGREATPQQQHRDSPHHRNSNQYPQDSHPQNSQGDRPIHRCFGSIGLGGSGRGETGGGVRGRTGRKRMEGWRGSGLGRMRCRIGMSDFLGG